MAKPALVASMALALCLLMPELSAAQDQATNASGAAVATSFYF
jgi:hypothetical protein